MTREMTGEKKKHASTYMCWSNMRARCFNPRHPNYKNYGARGIAICKRWSSFTAFLADMGPKPNGMSLERKNNNGDYTPSNCKWATKNEQDNNRRTCTYVEIEGQRLTITQAARQFGLEAKTVQNRMKRHGWDAITALQTPIGYHPNSFRRRVA